MKLILKYILTIIFLITLFNNIQAELLEFNNNLSNKKAVIQFNNKDTIKINHRKKAVFTKEGQIKSKIKRNRIFLYAKTFWFNNKLYKYKWKEYDLNGNILKKVIFRSSEFNNSLFPDSVEQIYDNMIEMLFYENQKPTIKIVKVNRTKGMTLYSVFTLYNYKNNIWIKEKDIECNEICKYWKGTIQ